MRAFFCGLDTSRSNSHEHSLAPMGYFQELTHFSPSDGLSLFCLQRTLAASCIVILDKTVSILDGYLGKSPVFVEHGEKVSLGGLFRKQIPYGLLISFMQLVSHLRRSYQRTAETHVEIYPTYPHSHIWPLPV